MKPDTCATCETPSNARPLYSADSKTWWCGHCLLVERERLLAACEALLSLADGDPRASADWKRICAEARAAIAESRKP